METRKITIYRTPKLRHGPWVTDTWRNAHRRHKGHLQANTPIPDEWRE